MAIVKISEVKVNVLQHGNPSDVAFTQDPVEVASTLPNNTDFTQDAAEVASTQPNDIDFTQVLIEVALGAAIVVACPATSTGTVGVPFGTAITVSGGTPPYTFSIVAGMLPPGLTLDPASGVISGTPTLAGTFSYTVQVVDHTGLTVQTSPCPITIAVPPPTGGVQFELRRVYVTMRPHERTPVRGS